MNTPIITSIIEDDIVWSKTLCMDLEQYPGIKVLETIHFAEKAEKEIPKLQPYLLFIDVEMPNMNGIEWLQELKRSLHSNTCIVFYCENEKYWKDALRVSAFDYLLKPYQQEDLRQIIERVRYKFQNNDSGFEQSVRKLLLDDRKFALQTVTDFLIVKRSEVIYFQYNNSSHVWHVFLTEQRTAKLRVSITAKDILNLNHSFCQANHSVIINIDYLASIDKNSQCVLYPPYDQLEIVISRRYFSKLKESLEII